MNVQMSYIIGSLVIFTMLAVVFNQKENYDLESRLYHEAVGEASELGNSLLIKLSKLPFDENTVSGSVESTLDLTATFSLGPETGENDVTLFDDVDDYNYFDGHTTEYFIKDNLNKLGVFSTTVNVNYIEKDTPGIVSTTRQFYKIINIEITNLYLNDPVKLFFITSY